MLPADSGGAATYIVDGQLGGVGKGWYISGEHLAVILKMPEAQTDMPLAPGRVQRLEACCAVAAAVENMTDATTAVKLLSGLFPECKLQV